MSPFFHHFMGILWLRRNYVTLNAPGRTGRSAPKAKPAQPKSVAAMPSTTSEPKGIMVPTGKVAKCSGINARMAKVRL